MKNSTVLMSALLLSVSTVFAQKGPDFSTPPAEPAVFAPGMISTGLNERDFALSPDGNLILYTVQGTGGSFQTILVRSKKKNGTWSEPERASFCGDRNDLEPAFSADGKKLFFASNRTQTGVEKANFDLYSVDWNGKSWGEAVRLGAEINTDGDEFYPSVASNGNLYFTAERAGGIGKEDIWKAVWKNGTYEPAVPLDSAVNSKGFEFNAFVMPDESVLLFTGYGRKDDTGRGDLYISRKNSSGNWLPAENLKKLNSRAIDYCPFVSADGKILFFTSERNKIGEAVNKSAKDWNAIKSILQSPENGFGDIYWVRFDAIK